MADSASDQLLQYRMALGLQKAGARDQAAAQQQASVQQLALQQGGIQGNRQLQGEKGVIDYALQAQSIGGQRQLANDQYGYNYGLQEQQGQQNWDLDHARFQHADELFQREQAGRIAELHLQQMQADKMARFQAQQDQQRLNQQQDFAAYQQQQDFGQANQHLAQQQDFSAATSAFDAQQQNTRQAAMFTHEAATAMTAHKGQQARDELLQRLRNGELEQEHKWKAEELAKEDKAKQELALDTHISSGVQKGLLYYPPEAVSALNKLESDRASVQGSMKYDDAQKQQWDQEHYFPKKQQLLRSAVPKPPTTIDKNTAIDQEYGPDFRKQFPDAPFHTDPKTGKQVIDDKAWGIIEKRKDRAATQQLQESKQAEIGQEKVAAAAERHEQFEFSKKQALQESQAKLQQADQEFHIKQRDTIQERRGMLYKDIYKGLQTNPPMVTEDQERSPANPARWLGDKTTPVQRKMNVAELHAEAARQVDEILPPYQMPQQQSAGQPPAAQPQPSSQSAPQQAPVSAQQPSKGQKHVEGAKIYEFDGTKWVRVQ